MGFSQLETSIYGWDFPWQTVSHNLDFPMDFLLQAEPRFGTSVPRATLTTTSATTPGGRGWHHGRKTWWGFPMENSTLKHGVPSGKRLHNYGKIHHFQWVNPL